MKNLNNIQEMKQFSIALQKFLKQNNIDVKQSLMLEGFAKSMDLPDWNTLSALLQKDIGDNYRYSMKPFDQAISGDVKISTEKKIIPAIDQSQFSYDTACVLRLGQQNCHLQYDNKTNLLLIGTESDNISSTIFLQCNDTSIFESIAQLIVKYIGNLAFEQPIFTVPVKDFAVHNGNIIFNFTDNTLSFKTNDNHITVHDINRVNILKQILKFCNDNTNVKIEAPQFTYPLTDSLLSNMATRYDHSFGLWAEDEHERAQEYLNSLRELHALFAQNYSNEEITAKLNFGEISVKQLRQEVEGNGFYNPSAYKSSRTYPHKNFSNKRMK